MTLRLPCVSLLLLLAACAPVQRLPTLGEIPQFELTLQTADSGPPVSIAQECESAQSVKGKN